MPLYVADYLRDTSHLRATESGAYLHLIMAYWANGKLPDDDRQLATIAKVSDREWKAMRQTIEAFFGKGFSTHKRIDTEIAKAKRVSSKRRDSAEQRWCKSNANAYANASPNADANGYTLHTTHYTEEIDRGAADIHAELLTIAGVDPDEPILFGSLYGIQGMLGRGFSRETILAGAANAMRGKARPPNWNYFAKCIESENEQRSAPARKETSREKPENLVDTARRLAGSGVKLGPRPSLMGCGTDGNPVRLLPAGRGERPGNVHDGGGGDAGGIPARGGRACDGPEDGSAGETEVPAGRGRSP